MAQPSSVAQGQGGPMVPVPMAREVGSEYPYGAWRTGICACCSPKCDCALCCDGCWCWPCDTSRVYNVLRHERPYAVHMPVCLTLTFAEACFRLLTVPIIVAARSDFGVAEILSCLFYSIFNIWFRNTFTKKYNIQEDPCSTCCFAVCCPACSTCQMMVQLQDSPVPAGGQCCWNSGPPPRQSVSPPPNAVQVHVGAGPPATTQPGYVSEQPVVGVPIQSDPQQDIESPQGKCAA
eukprot:TRINITY_DN14709_c0_g1_i1.p1 TRINITY_DN14709_c0_g1~~TRINITY_DN14709_c0_g1_i1.p1  ORF type:complete len:235 (+),score=51.44 TRINITY_DN14709_c0_g1_i1:77-781(+)